MSKRSFNRLPKYELVDTSTLRIEPGFQPDPTYVALYRDFHDAKRITTRTRLNLDLVVPGTPRKDVSGAPIFTQNSADPGQIVAFADRITSGYRPALVLYAADDLGLLGKYVCCDDVLAFHAYRHLGINLVPVHILNGKLLGVSEGCYKLKRPKYNTLKWTRPDVTSYQMLFGGVPFDQDFDAAPAISHFSKLAKLVAAWVREFDKGTSQRATLDYNRTLHSVAYRLGEMADAILLLLAAKMSFQALGILRGAYELSLNFYVDWLAPESMGPLLQASAACQIPGDAQQTKVRLKQLRSSLGTSVDLAENVRERASISPLGVQFYENAYAYLSKVAHQDFSVTEAYQDTLVSDREHGLDAKMRWYLLSWLDAIYTSTLLRLADDIGRGSAFETAARQRD